MFSTKHFRFSSLAVLALVSLASVSCGKDKSLDEYQQQQSNEEFAKLQKNAGTFRGNLLIQGNGPTVNAGIEIRLVVGFDTVPNGNNSGQNTRANLRGNVVIYNNGTQGAAVITTASFLKAPDQDSDTVGTVNGQLTVTLGTTGATSQTATFNFSGSKNNNQLNGMITPSSLSGVTGNFTTTKDAPLPHGQGSILPGPDQTRPYAGRALDPTCSGGNHNAACPDPDRNGNVYLSVVMTVNPGVSSTGYEFVNAFVDEKLYNVHLELDDSIIQLPPVTYSQSNRTLAYNGPISANGESSQVIFKCVESGNGYNCSYENVARAVVYNFSVMPTSSSNPRPNPAPTPTPIHNPPPSPVPGPVHDPHGPHRH